MLFDIMDVIVGWCEDLLIFMSKLQYKAAVSEIKQLKALRVRIREHQAKVQDDLNEVENAIDELQYWLDQEYKEL